MHVPSIEAVNDWDGSWYDVDLARSAVVAQDDRFGVKIIYQEGDDEDADVIWPEELPKRLRLSSQPVQDGECRRLQPGTPVVVLVKWPHMDEQKYYDAEVIASEFREHGPDEGECRCVFRVKFVYHHEPAAKKEGEFVAPVNTRFVIEDMCFPCGSAMNHPVVKNWVQEIQEMTAAKQQQQQKGLFTISSASGSAAGTEAQRQQIIRQAMMMTPGAGQQQQQQPSTTVQPRQQQQQPSTAVQPRQQQQQPGTAIQPPQQQQQQSAAGQPEPQQQQQRAAAAPPAALADKGQKDKDKGAPAAVSAQQAAAAAALSGVKRPAAAAPAAEASGAAAGQAAKRPRSTIPPASQSTPDDLLRQAIALAGAATAGGGKAPAAQQQAALSVVAAALAAAGKPVQLPPALITALGGAAAVQKALATAVSNAASTSTKSSPASTTPGTPAVTGTSGGQTGITQQQQQQQQKQARSSFQQLQQLQQGGKAAARPNAAVTQQLQIQNFVRQLQQTALAAAAQAGGSSGAGTSPAAKQQQQQQQLQQLFVMRNPQLAALQQAALLAKLLQSQSQQQAQKQQQQQQQQQAAPQTRGRKRSKADNVAGDSTVSKSAAGVSNVPVKRPVGRPPGSGAAQQNMRAARAAAAAVAAAAAAAASDSEGTGTEDSHASHAAEPHHAGEGDTGLVHSEHGEVGIPQDVTDAQRKYFLDNKQGKPTVWMRGEEHGFPKGWFIIERTRITGASQGTKDRYYVPPDGRMVRTRNEALARAEEACRFQLLVDAAEQVWEDETKLPVPQSLEGPALVKHATAVQGAVMMVLNEHNTVAQKASLPLRLSDITTMAKLHSNSTLRLLPAAASSLYAAAAAHLASHTQEARLTAEQAGHLLSALAVLLEVPGKEDDARKMLAGSAGTAATDALAKLAAPLARHAPGTVQPYVQKPGSMLQHWQLETLTKEQWAQQLQESIIKRVKGWYGCSPRQLNQYLQHLVEFEGLTAQRKEQVLQAAAAAAAAATAAQTAARIKADAAATAAAADARAAPAPIAITAAAAGKDAVAELQAMDVDMQCSDKPAGTETVGARTTVDAVEEKAQREQIVAAVVSAAFKAVVDKHAAAEAAEKRLQMLAAMSQQLHHLQSRLVHQLEDALLVLRGELASMAPYKRHLTAPNTSRVQRVLELLGLPGLEKWPEDIAQMPGTSPPGQQQVGSAAGPAVTVSAVSPEKVPVVPLPAAMQQLRRTQQQQQQQQASRPAPAAAGMIRQLSGAEAAAAADQMRVTGVKDFVEQQRQNVVAIAQQAAKHFAAQQRGLGGTQGTVQQQQQTGRPGPAGASPPQPGAAAAAVGRTAPAHGIGSAALQAKIAALDPTAHGQALVKDMIQQLKAIVPSPVMSEAQRAQFRNLMQQSHKAASAQRPVAVAQGPQTTHEQRGQVVDAHTNKATAQQQQQRQQQGAAGATGGAGAPRLALPGTALPRGPSGHSPGVGHPQQQQGRPLQQLPSGPRPPSDNRGKAQPGPGRMPSAGVQAGQRPQVGPGPAGRSVPMTSPQQGMPGAVGRVPHAMTGSMPAAVAVVPGPGGMMMPVGIAVQPGPVYFVAQQQQQQALGVPRPQAAHAGVGRPLQSPAVAPAATPAAHPAVTTEAVVIDG